MNQVSTPDVPLTEQAFDNEYYFSLYPDVANHYAYAGVANGGWLHWQAFGHNERRNARALPEGQVNPPVPVPSQAHRPDGYNCLSGRGLEIGALHQPAQVPASCQVKYCDAAPRDVLIQYFPELSINDLVAVDYVSDLDVDGLTQFVSDQFDFVIFNHVIEHVANPIQVVGELFRVVKPGGHVVISAPDKNYTFDRRRALTPFAHLLTEYRNQVTAVTDEHYLDFLRVIVPCFDQLPAGDIQIHLDATRNRREHAHVWDSASFRQFLIDTFALLHIRADCVFSHGGEQNYFEYFAVWQKQ